MDNQSETWNEEIRRCRVVDIYCREGEGQFGLPCDNEFSSSDGFLHILDHLFLLFHQLSVSHLYSMGW